MFNNEAKERWSLGELTQCPEVPVIPGVPKNAGTLALQVYPNPATNGITLELADPLGAVSVGLFDLTGRLVVDQSFRHRERLSISLAGVPPGVYLLKVSADEETSMVKVVKH